jgi:hypothetical protein
VTEQRSLIAYDHWRLASDKVDYFVLSISAALTAYLGQHAVVTPLAVDPATLELASLLLFAASTVFGIDRIQANVTSLGAESGFLEAFERAGQLRIVLQTESGTQLIDSVSGETYTLAVAQQKIEAHDRRATGLHAQKEKWQRRSERSYKFRDICLKLGVTLYAAAKLWSAIHAR